MPTTHRALPIAAAVLASAPGALGAPTTTIAGGKFIWTDRVGAQHAAKGMYYELYEFDSSTSSQNLGSGHTSTGAGGISMITNEEDGIFDYTLEVWMRIFSRNELVGSAKTVAGDEHSAIYPGLNAYWEIPIGAGTDGVPAGSFGDIVVDNDTDFGRSVGALQAMHFMADYYSNTLNLTVPKVTLRYDPTFTDTSGYAGDNIDLSYADWDDWDVIFHEYGHHIAEHNNLHYRSTGPADDWGGNHTFATDNISGASQSGQDYGKEKGTRLAWGEGVATTLGFLAIHGGNLNAAIPNLPANDLDLNFRHTITAGGPGQPRVPDTVEDPFQHSIEIMDGGAKGEGDEYSVVATLWDLYDNTPTEALLGFRPDPFHTLNARTDRVSMTDAKLLDSMKNVGTFRDFWSGFAVTADTAQFKMDSLGLPGTASTAEALSTIGEILEAHSLAARPGTAGYITSPDLYFQELNYGHSDVFRIAIYDAYWDLVHLSGLLTDTDAQRYSDFSYFITADLEQNVQYRWVVLSTSIWDNAAPPEDLRKWYWSGANAFILVPCPDALALVSLLTPLASARRRRDVTESS